MPTNHLFTLNFVTAMATALEVPAEGSMLTLGTARVSRPDVPPRAIREGVADSADMLDYYDGSTSFRSAQWLAGVSQRHGGGPVAFPVSGDDIARLTVPGVCDERP